METLKLTQNKDVLEIDPFHDPGWVVLSVTTDDTQQDADFSMSTANMRKLVDYLQKVLEHDASLDSPDAEQLSKALR